MNVQFTISAPVITNCAIAVVYYNNEPFEVARFIKMPPHNKPYNCKFTDLPIGKFKVNIHESEDGVMLGTLMHSFWIKPIIKLPRIVKARKSKSESELV
jgi:hypothetical protein